MYLDIKIIDIETVSRAVPPGNNERRVSAFGAVTKVLANVAPSVSITSPKNGESLR